MSEQQPIYHLRAIISLWKKLEFLEKGFAPDPTSERNTKGQVLTAGDAFAEKTIAQYIAEQNLLWNLLSEELGTVSEVENSTHVLQVDPVDGSANAATIVEAQIKNEQINSEDFPFGLLQALFANNDVYSLVVAALYVHPFNDGFFFYDEKTIDQNEKQIALPNPPTQELRVGTSRASLEQLRQNPVEGISPQATGSMAGVLRLLLLGELDAIATAEVGFEEIGTVAALVRGAGGIVSDFNGNEIEDRKMKPPKRHTIIAGQRDVVQKIRATKHLIDRLRA